jgi:TPR repeat protein
MAPSADQGDANAEAGVAFMHLKGYGVAGPCEAMRWYRKAPTRAPTRAASASVPERVCVRRTMAGQGVRMAADQDSGEAQSNIGFL